MTYKRVHAVARRSSVGPLVAAALWLISPAAMRAQAVGTTTDLSGSATTVNAGTAVSLTATVLTTASTPVTAGQVGFCDAAVTPRCEFPDLLAVVQLNGSGAATLVSRPRAGSHTYRAFFLGTSAASASTSSTAVPLTVTASNATTTTLTADGNSVVATVTGTGATAAPTGTVSFVDSSNGNASLGSAPLQTGTVTKSFNTGASPLLLDSSGTPQAIATGDFNKDGNLDVAVISLVSGASRSNGYPGNFKLLLGDGHGGFNQSFTLPTTSSSAQQKILVADFNQDGNLDVAFFGTDYEYVLYGDGQGGFPTHYYQSDNMGNAVNFTGVGDFNGDGLEDAIGLTVNPGIVYLYQGQTDGQFSQRATISLGSGNYVTGFAVTGYFLTASGSDPYQDLVLPGQSSGTPGFFTVISNGNNTFATPVFTATGSGRITGAVAADFNGDGYEDVALLDSNKNITVMLGSSSGFAQGTVIASGQTGGLAVADVDQDGNADLVAYGANGPTVFYGNGTGSFPTSVTASQSGSSAFVAPGDYNGDGLPDLLALESVSGSGSYLLPEASVFTDVASTAAVSVYPKGGGSHNVVANYPGDGNFQGGDSAAVSINGTTDSVTVPAQTYNPSDASTVLTATVQYNSVPPTGATVFQVDGGSALNSTCKFTGSGMLTCSISYPTQGLSGNHTLTVTVLGDADYLTVSGSGSLTVGSSKPSVQIAVQNVTIAAGTGSTTLSFVGTFQAGVIPTGTTMVTVDGGTAVNTGCSLLSASSAVCSAQYPTGSLAPGAHTITGILQGDANYNTSTGTGVLTVQ